MDWSLFHDVNTFAARTGWAHGPVRAYAEYGIAVFGVLLLVAGFLSLREGPRPLARTLWAVAAPLIAVAVNQPIANAVGRARPYDAHPNVVVLISRSTDPSFMSDHSLAAGAVAAALCFVSWRLGWIAIVLAACMAFARVYVGAHYPGDVLAGLAFGALVASAGVPIVDRLVAPLVERVLGTPIGRRLAAAVPGSTTAGPESP